MEAKQGFGMPVATSRDVDSVAQVEQAQGEAGRGAGVELEACPGSLSFDDLFTQHYALVYGIGLKFTGSPEDAEDITQDVFTKVWKNLGAFGHNSSLRTWIYRIAVNVCIDTARKPWKKYDRRNTELEAALGDGEESGLPSNEETAERALLEREEAARVRRAVARLKPHLRAVVVLKDLEEMSYQQVASAMGLSLGTISSRLNRARKALQSLLQPGLAVAPQES
jgi:RNA polymerase sigma-70 factor (ECF subfamily)